MHEVPVATLPIPKDAQTVLIYGGAFDPPHRAHVELPPRARDAVAADLLLYMPAAKAPMKPGPVASSEDRIAMLEAALKGVPRVAVTTLELQRPGDSYTIDTLKAIKADRPYVALRLLIGADQARQFHKWRSARDIIALAEPAVMLRPPLDSAEGLLADMAPHWSESEMSQWGGRLIELPAIDASSTRARRLLAENPRDPELQKLLPDPVLAVIRERNLYKAENAPA